MVQSAVLRLHVVCLSACVSVTLLDQILETKGRGRIQGLPNFLRTPISPGTLKAMNFKFGRNIRRLNPSKRPLKILETIGGVGVARDSRKFSGQRYIGRIARSSLR